MSECASSLSGLGMRVSLVDDCYKPIPIEENPRAVISSPAWTSISLSPNIETGEQFRRKRADGEWCINKNDQPDILMGFDATWMLCDLGLLVKEMLTCATLIADEGGIKGGVLNGYNSKKSKAGCKRKAIVEIFTENGNSKECDEDGNAYRYIRWILPITFKWQLGGEITINETDIVEIELTGYVESNPFFVSPLGNDADPDLDEKAIQQIRCGGPLAWVCTNTLPEFVGCGDDDVCE